MQKANMLCTWSNGGATVVQLSVCERVVDLGFRGGPPQSLSHQADMI